MKKFKFDLEQVLRMKHWREEDAKKALAAEVLALEALKDKLVKLEGEFQELLASDRSANEMPGGETPLMDFRGRLGILQYARHLGTLIAGQHGDIEAQGVKLKEKSDLLLKAMQERKVVEKLKERRQEEYRLQRNRFNYAVLDESSAGYLRRNAAREAGEGEISEP